MTKRSAQRTSGRASGPVCLAVLVLGGTLCRVTAREPALPPPPLTVSAGMAAAYQRVPVHLIGVDVNPETHDFWRVERDSVAAVLPPCGQELVFDVTLSAPEVERRVRVDGSVRDDGGTELAALGEEITVAAGDTVTRAIVVRPGRDNPGPYFLTGTWRDLDVDLRGTFAATGGQANVHLVVEDYEQICYPDPGATLESSPAAAHRGRTGLLVRLRADKDPGAEGKPVQVTIPLGMEMPGRPVKIGLWMQAAAEVSLTARFRDPGIEVRQSIQIDTWTVGPVTVLPGQWRYVEIPVPGYSRPAGQRRPYGEPNGIVDYPLTLEALVVDGSDGTDVGLDDIDAWSQENQGSGLSVRASFDKPLGLLYPNDTLDLVVANRWLWDEAQAASLSASLDDIGGGERPLYNGEVTVPAGQEKVLPITLAALPVGGYRLEAILQHGGDTPVSLSGNRRALVYRPRGGQPGYAELFAYLRDRNEVLADVGFDRDIIMIPWHSVDGSPSVEPQMGLWRYDWIAPQVSARRQVGLEVIGRLGFTPLWADPTATWNKRMRCWYGSTTGMPSRNVYWEEYVLRTVEHFADTIGTWIVWDRPDSGALGATAEEYAEDMVAVAAAAARQASPGARIISGGITRDNVETYLLALAETGVSAYLDGIGIVPTTAPLSPEDGYLDVLLARAQRIRREERLKPELSVLNLGWGTGEGQYNVSEFDQARYVARAYVLCRAAGITDIHLQASEPGTGMRRDSAAFVFAEDGLHAPKAAALAVRTVRRQLGTATFRREIFLGDRQTQFSRCYLFSRPDGSLVLTAWRRQGESRLQLPTAPELTSDLFGNPLPPTAGKGTAPVLVLRPEPAYLLFRNLDADTLARQLTRAPMRYTDTPESAWKSAFGFHLDVGDATDEAAADYRASDSRIVGPVDSYYHNDYGPHVVDSGRHFRGEERFTINVASYRDADLILRRRINYGVANQQASVYCSDEYVGEWFAFKRDPRYRWRNTEFIIPNRCFAGRDDVEIRLVASGEGEVTSYYYWGGPLRTRVLFASDLSLLAATSGYGPGIRRDRNILGGELTFHKAAGTVIAKGIGTNAAGELTDSLVVIALNRQYKRFRATVGLDAAADGRGSVRFRVHDGAQALWDSKDMTFYSDPQEVDIDVSDAILLMLWAGDSGDGNRDDMANWANARLELK